MTKKSEQIGIGKILYLVQIIEGEVITLEYIVESIEFGDIIKLQCLKGPRHFEVVEQFHMTNPGTLFGTFSLDKETAITKRMNELFRIKEYLIETDQDIQKINEDLKLYLEIYPVSSQSHDKQTIRGVNTVHGHPNGYKLNGLAKER